MDLVIFLTLSRKMSYLKPSCCCDNYSAYPRKFCSVYNEVVLKFFLHVGAFRGFFLMYPDVCLKIYKWLTTSEAAYDP